MGTDRTSREESPPSIATWGIAACTMTSLVVVLSTGLIHAHGATGETASRAEVLRIVLPTLVAFGAAVSGFRVIAALAAIGAALWWGFLFGFVLLMSLGTEIGANVMFAMQVLSFGFAVADLIMLSRHGWAPVSWPRRVAGPIAAALLFAYVYTNVLRQDQAAARAAVDYQEKHIRDSLGQIQKHAAELASPAWKYNSSLRQLHTLAHCIDVYHRSGPGPSFKQPFPRSATELVRWATGREQSAYQGECWRVMRDADTTHSPVLLDPHHLVRYTPPSNLADTVHSRGYLLEIEARWDSTDGVVSRSDRGSLNYLLDRRGRVHASPAQRRATLADPVLPPCPPSSPDLLVGCWNDKEI